MTTLTDYVMASMSVCKEVTPENNAAVLLVKAFGPSPDNTKRPAAYYEWLKIPVPPEKGDDFVIREGDFFREHLKLDPREHLQKFWDDKDAAYTKPWTAMQYPHVAAWLKVTEKPQALAIEASTRPRYYSPLVPSKPGELLFVFNGGMFHCRHIGTPERRKPQGQRRQS